jgi:hypothetical protein
VRRALSVSGSGSESPRSDGPVFAAAEILSAVMDDLRDERLADLPTIRVEVKRALDVLRPVETGIAAPPATAEEPQP